MHLFFSEGSLAQYRPKGTSHSTSQEAGIMHSPGMSMMHTTHARARSRAHAHGADDLVEGRLPRDGREQAVAGGGNAVRADADAAVAALPRDLGQRLGRLGLGQLHAAPCASAST